MAKPASEEDGGESQADGATKSPSEGPGPVAHLKVSIVHSKALHNNKVGPGPGRWETPGGVYLPDRVINKPGADFKEDLSYYRLVFANLGCHFFEKHWKTKKKRSKGKHVEAVSDKTSEDSMMIIENPNNTNSFQQTERIETEATKRHSGTQDSNSGALVAELDRRAFLLISNPGVRRREEQT